jgi:hypothetical protein
MSLGFGGVYAALYSGSRFADVWVQTNAQATLKGNPGRDGQLACATHVATLTATQAAFLALACAATGERLNARRVALGLGVNAVSHYVADRRAPLRWLADRLQGTTGKRDFWEMGQAPLASGAHALDQAWHDGWCAVAAAIIAGKD